MRNPHTGFAIGLSTRRAYAEIPEGIYVAATADFYDVAPDDERFLMLRSVGGEGTGATEPRLILVQKLLRGAEAAGSELI